MQFEHKRAGADGGNGQAWAAEGGPNVNRGAA